MVRTQIQLSDAQAAALKARAAKEQVSMSELIRRSVDRMLAADEPADREEIRRRALAAIGSVHSGAADLSADHDRYLAEAYGE